MSSPTIDEIDEAIEDVEVEDTLIEDKIIKLLEIYPKISPSMMQIGIGSSLPAKMWRPILHDLIERKLVQSDTIVALSATGRSQSYTILSLVQSNTAG